MAPGATPTAGQTQANNQANLNNPTATEGRKGEQHVNPAANANCTLQVPARPLSAQGLATPYQLTGTGDGGPCNEANADQSAFVEAAIVDRATGAVQIYHPLVIDQGTQPAAPPVVPQLTRTSTVGIWFGFNGDVLSLRRTNHSLGQGKCVNGLGASKFGQFAYCNAPAFFRAANAAMTAGRLKVPPLGTGMDGMTCPTTRDFGIVDQDQSDNVVTTYLATADGRTAQNTALTSAQIGANATMLANGSDNRLLDAFVDPAIGCTPFTAPDMTNNGAPTSALALNELQAAANQAAPVAMMPLNNPMTLVNNLMSVVKTNLYRVGVNQGPVNVATDTPLGYCTNLQNIGGQRLAVDQAMFQRTPSPDAAFNNLFDFMTDRFKMSLVNLKCPGAAQAQQAQ